MPNYSKNPQTILWATKKPLIVCEGPNNIWKIWVHHSFLLGAKQHLELPNEIISLWSTLVWQVLLQVSHHSVVISYINASTFLQGSRQQFNVEECAWRIQEGARPIQLMAAIEVLTRNVCDLWKYHRHHQCLSSRFYSDCTADHVISPPVTWPTPCRRNNQTPTFQSKENATTMADDQGLLCYFGSKVSTPAAASVLYCFCPVCQEVEGEECPCLYF